MTAFLITSFTSFVLSPKDSAPKFIEWSFESKVLSLYFFPETSCIESLTISSSFFLLKIPNIFDNCFVLINCLTF